MNIKKITAQNAVIKTASVEVKTLTISGKQVTLAVFRQLLERPLIDLENLKLNGIPWGWVNYHIDKCADRAGYHKHIVWQHGLSLYRSEVQYMCRPPIQDKLDEIMQIYSVIEYLEEDGEGWTAENNKMIKEVKVGSGNDAWSLKLRVPEVQRYFPNGIPVPHEAAHRFLDSVPSFKGLTKQDVLERTLLPILRERFDWIVRYRNLYMQLTELDQLFIAV